MGYLLLLARLGNSLLQRMYYLYYYRKCTITCTAVRLYGCITIGMPWKFTIIVNVVSVLLISTCTIKFTCTPVTHKTGCTAVLYGRSTPVTTNPTLSGVCGIYHCYSCSMPSKFTIIEYFRYYYGVLNNPGCFRTHETCHNHVTWRGGHYYSVFSI
eukprot:SAG31_NODE_3110_length_4664_cov_16.074699_1_plen_156_part_00